MITKLLGKLELQHVNINQEQTAEMCIGGNQEISVRTYETKAVLNIQNQLSLPIGISNVNNQYWENTWD